MDEVFEDFAGALLVGTGIAVADVASVACGDAPPSEAGTVAAAALRDGWAAASRPGEGVGS